ncbi:Uncharacterized protein At3g61260 [Linum grandiflorum]
MEYLIKQTKGKASGQPKASAAAGTERRVLPKTQSFKDKRRVWFGSRSSSRRFDLDSDTMGIEQATAVAAAAYAIAATERPSNPERRRMFKEEPQPSLARIRSERQDGAKLGSLSVRHSEGTDSDEDYYDTAPAMAVPPVSSMKRRPTFADKPASSMKKNPSFKEKSSSVGKPVPTMEKLPDSAEMQLNYDMEEDSKQRKAKNAESQTEMPYTKPEISMVKPEATFKPAIPSIRASARTETEQTAADAWEKVEFEKLREKYELENEQIDKWENQKKASAKRRLDKAEGTERTRLKALERYRSDMDAITQIAEEARASTAKKQRKDELKVKEKANLYRRTGKVPKTSCSCF